MNNYPDGAEHDPNAPWNARDVTECDECGGQAEDELVETYDRSEGTDRWLCESCAELAQCNACQHWYSISDTIDGVCIDCAEPYLTESK